MAAKAFHFIEIARAASAEPGPGGRRSPTGLRKGTLILYTIG